VEEVLYIAMEDYVIDIVMPDGENMRIPINPFTLIGATTKSESLSQPLKNRFVYQFHFMDYSTQEKQHIIQTYLDKHEVPLADSLLLDIIHEKVDSVPREIHNMCVKLRDYIISHNIKVVDSTTWEAFLLHAQIDEGGMSILHKKYLEILSNYDRPIGLRTIAVQLGMHEKAVEEDIEPLLLKLGKIEKKAGGRCLA
jgi:Holliday junction DNA helicase RuvB